jgi:hypothetical protein
VVILHPRITTSFQHSSIAMCKLVLLPHSHLFFFLFAVLGLELRAFPLSHSTSPIFCDRVFRDSVLKTICSGWLQTTILLISASWVARITGVSHWHPASLSRIKLWTAMVCMWCILQGFVCWEWRRWWDL